MATSSSTSTLLVALKSSFIILMFIMAVALAYTLIMDGDSSCFDPNAWWTIAAVTNVFVFIAFIVAWFFYKESSWMKRVVLMFMLFWCGSFVTCGYIVLLFFKLSPEESLSDPLYFVLVRRQKTDVTGHMRKSTVVIAKLIVTSIACCLLGIVIYACIIDGFPFYVELLTP
ncbi:hypothetical protein E3N88_07658 [Mikania micrantha]|uniref:Uncharacterized protein n=1 Tax=Mikania micrantha TaxID=192012 RepID=A0A5N6PT75_9ASTR|nr:hypothetical protein E3N88_07658 [Mikania micrantha]